MVVCLASMIQLYIPFISSPYPIPKLYETILIGGTFLSIVSLIQYSACPECGVEVRIRNLGI